ncbi:MAG TPA: transglycosylase SLT domain-containing protein [Bacteroidia bacterium]|nr:transglycosylase SLT domain-containing protein [Bacteroidia bacterium]
MQKAYRYILFYPLLILGVFFSIPALSSDIIKKVVVNDKDTFVLKYFDNSEVLSSGWTNIQQPMFWKEVMNLSADSCLVNVASSRRILTKLDFNVWKKLEENQKTAIKDSIKELYCIAPEEEIYITSGKRFFYEHKKSLEYISRSVQAFKNNNVDPWYAQTILLIESPGKHKAQSYVGARGPFQLMRSVALKYGLKVNKYVDERTDLERSAYAASRLIKEICIPYTRNILDSLKIPYQENETWFRLLVMHVYHAGARNVTGACYKLNPAEGGIGLIRNLWSTQWGGFKNESQNYSQIALAAVISFEQMMSKSDTLILIEGDHLIQNYHAFKPGIPRPVDHLDLCLNAYKNDLRDGIINFNTYVERTGKVYKELEKISDSRKSEFSSRLGNEFELITVARELMLKKELNDAIGLLKVNYKNFPRSKATLDTLSRAYKLKGDLAEAQRFSNLSNQVDVLPNPPLQN